MEFIIIIVIVLLINYSISFYFSMRGLEALWEFDFERDKAIFEELGIKNADDIVEKVKEKRLWFTLLAVASIVISIVYLILLVLFMTYSFNKVMIGVSIVGTFSILVFLDKWLNLQEILKMINIEYRNAIAEESKRLAPIRIFYVISSIVLIVAIIIIQETYSLKTTNLNYYNISLSVMFIYLGGMGLIAKIMFLKVPFKLDGKLQPFINTIVLGYGLYLLISSWINTL